MSCIHNLTSTCGHPYVSVRDPEEYQGWKFIDKKTGAIYGSDNDSTMRIKFLKHTFLCPFLSITRFVNRVLWVGTGFSIENGYKLGKHRWQNIKIRYLQNPGANSEKPGRALRYFVIGGSIFQQLAKDICKTATYPAAAIALEFVSISGIFFPHTARRAIVAIDNKYTMETIHGNTYQLRFEGSLRNKWKDLISFPLGAANLSMPCMHPAKSYQKINYHRFYYNNKKDDYEIVSRQKIGFGEFFNSLETKRSYFTNGEGEVDPAFQDLINYAAFIQPLKTMRSNEWNQQLQDKVSSLLSIEKKIIQIMNAQADCKMGSLEDDKQWAENFLKAEYDERGEVFSENALENLKNEINENEKQRKKISKKLKKERKKLKKENTSLKEKIERLERDLGCLKNGNPLQSLIIQYREMFTQEVAQFKEHIVIGPNFSEEQQNAWKALLEKNQYGDATEFLYERFSEMRAIWKRQEEEAEEAKVQPPAADSVV